MNAWDIVGKAQETRDDANITVTKGDDNAPTPAGTT